MSIDEFDRLVRVVRWERELYLASIKAHVEQIADNSDKMAKDLERTHSHIRQTAEVIGRIRARLQLDRSLV